jgi:hypothetical protein
MSHSARQRITRYYETMYFEKYDRLIKSMEIDYCLSCGCPEYTWHTDKRVTQPHVNIRYRADHKKPALHNFTGLVCKLTLGLPSILTLRVSETIRCDDVNVSLFLPKDGQPLTMNDTPITFLMVERKPDGRTNIPVYNMQDYFQIDCRREMRLLTDAYHYIAKLRRNEKTYFSLLPKEMIRLIQKFLFIH